MTDGGGASAERGAPASARWSRPWPVANDASSTASSAQATAARPSASASGASEIAGRTGPLSAERATGPPASAPIAA